MLRSPAIYLSASSAIGAWYTGLVRLVFAALGKVSADREQGEGYAVAYALAEDNLRAGRTVVADCVNPWTLTRTAWRSVAERAGVAALDVEIVCSDAAEHRRRVESREADIPGHALPTWRDVVERDYHAWDRDRLVVDTAAADIAAAVRAIVLRLSELMTHGRGR